MQYIDPQALQTFIHGNAGAMAGLVSTLLLFPIENIKTRMHVTSKQDRNEPQNLEGAIATMRRVMRHEGIPGMYKGFAPLAIGHYLSYGLYFYCYNYFKRKYEINRKSHILAFVRPAFYSGCITSILSNPFWVAQSRQIFDKERLTTLEIFQKLIKEEGILSLFKGLRTSIILVINPIIQFLIYEIFKRRFRAFIHFVGGAISKALATFLTYPYQLLRTNAHIDHNRSEYILTAKKIFNDQGLKGFFRGLQPKLIQTMLNSAVLFVCYEKFVKLLQQLLMKAITYILQRKFAIKQK